MEGTFVGAGGTQLYFRRWRPEAPRSVIVATHGMGDHSGGLSQLIEPLVNRGYVVYAHDLRGHGRSPGQRGHVDRWQYFQDDLDAMTTLASREESGLPMFLLGHSLGGLITLDYALHHPQTTAGVVTIAPLVASATPAWQFHVISLLARLAPSWAMNSKQDYMQLTRDRAMVDRMAADALRHGAKTSAIGREIFGALRRVRARAGELCMPLLMLYGDADPITPAAGLDRFFGGVGSGEKARHLYPGALHRPFDDLCSQEMLDDLIAWLERRTA